jgi:signal transduction histidine kinase
MNSSRTPARILVIDDNKVIHDDFRRVLAPDIASSEDYDQAAAALFGRQTEIRPDTPLEIDFASQGKEALECVERALQIGKPYAMAFVDMRMPPGWDGLETIERLWRVQPELLMVICTAFSDYTWEEISNRLGRSDRFLIIKKPFDNIEVRQFAHGLTARSALEQKLKDTQQHLIEASRLAGKAEVATSVLHNVGNVLNSVNVSGNVISERLRNSRLGALDKTAAMIDQHRDDFSDFVTNDPRGQRIPELVASISSALREEHGVMIAEVGVITANIGHIKEIVAMQQSYASVCGMIEPVQLEDIVGNALKMNGTSLDRRRIKLVHEYSRVPDVQVDKHKVLQILVNLLTNAEQALDETDHPDKQITLCIAAKGERFVTISVSDNGIGIPAANLSKIFSHGFTTKKTGHGFGLHSCILAAAELGGSLKVTSSGPGTGSTFTLDLPITVRPPFNKNAPTNAPATTIA